VEKLLNVLLIEDDQEECKEFEKHIGPKEDVRLIGITNNEIKALEYVKDCLPDAVILDLELHRGSGNGISFLETLGNMNIKPMPYILVTTHNISRITHERIRQLGADFVMVKSQEDYSVENVIGFLLSHKKLIHDLRIKMQREYNFAEKSPFEEKKRLKVRVAAEIDKIGISPKAMGRDYLIEAILYKINGQPEFFAEISKKYGKTNASVQRAMQNAINRAWYTTHPDDLMKHYTARVRSDKGVPTVMEFVYHYGNKLKVEY